MTSYPEFRVDSAVGKSKDDTGTHIWGMIELLIWHMKELPGDYTAWFRKCPGRIKLGWAACRPSTVFCI